MTKSQNTKNEQQKDLCITVEKQVWESTLNHSMVLEAENAWLKELLKECSIANTALVSIMDWLRKATIPEQRENCVKLFEKTQELQKRLDKVLK